MKKKTTIEVLIIGYPWQLKECLKEEKRVKREINKAVKENSLDVDVVYKIQLQTGV
jgi:hypothetical protein